MGIEVARNAADNARTVRAAIRGCGAIIGPEGERCAVPSPCPEHEKEQTMAARIAELEGHRGMWRRKAACHEDDVACLRGLLRAVRSAAERGDLAAVLVLTEPTGVLAVGS